MKQIFTVVVSLLIMLLSAPAIWATAQQPEKMDYNGEAYEMYTTPFEALFPDDLRRPGVLLKVPPPSSCWRRYVGTWRIKEGQLFLISLQSCSSKRQDIPLDAIDPSWKSPVPAKWFSGSIRLGRGEVTEYAMGLGMRLSDEVFLEIKDGRVIASTKGTQTKGPVGGPKPEN